MGNKKTKQVFNNHNNLRSNNKALKNKMIIIKNIFVIMFTILMIAIIYFVYMEYRPKFRNSIIELGTNEISVENFLVSNRYVKHARILTDLKKIDFTKVSEVDIKLSYKGREETVKLLIIDTKAPVVKFQNISKYIGYKINADDFIVDKIDLSEMTVTATQIGDTTKFNNYVVKVTVEDRYGNKTTQDCILTITWLKPIVYIELGSDFSKESVLVNIEKDEFVMPILYSMAKKIHKAQQSALKNGDSLKIYETYRPYEVQAKVLNGLRTLAISNNDVNNGINTGNWSMTWFIATGLSNHQLGVAIDTSLVKVNSYKIKTMEKFKYMEIVDYIEYDMPTNMHELSAKSAVFAYGIPSNSKTKWKNAPLASTITEGAVKLQNYCTSADLTPLASEWWHFNDLDAKNIVRGKSRGQYYLSGCASRKEID
jgi:D-alanyl-D-alanine dipeptidase